ncbi:alkaline phosphatase family protein [Rhodonellum sp.]|uniref:alkaline phosphatase family protein n=1 Tax=Rhodonellum sp. TaxID=2231180 RepID=UPI00271A5385|nr:alkaline phosphatase family protein [Rhodonellum sp.]MDO9553290.1 alkaline phosphatase family protein [Rhodonellum sp.]
MNKNISIKSIVIPVILIGLTFFSCMEQEKSKPDLKTVVIIIDGLRKDYLSETNSPNLYKLSKMGVEGLHSHSIFPTLTRVNSTSYATGSYPVRHGILGNSIYLPAVDAVKGINTGDFKALMKADSVEKGRLLLVKTFGEWVEDQGETDFTIFSSGTTGQSFLLNQRIKGRGIINPDLILPSNLEKEVIAKVGEIPAKERPNLPRHKWITDAFIEFDLKSDKSSISTIWFSDPDGTAHATGIGSPMTLASIKGVDDQVGRILQYIQENGMENQVNIIISSDHGFSTHIGEGSLEDFLIEKGLKTGEDSDDVIVVGNAVYVKDKAKIRTIAEAFQKEDWVGAVFSKEEETANIPGTLSQHLIYWQHAERAADLYVDVNWNDEENEFGYKGASFNRGTAGHGSSSPFEMQTPFIAVGPSFKKQFANPLPTALIDIMPTVLHIHGIKIDQEIDGRVLDEILVENTAFYSEQPQKTLKVEHKIDGIFYKIDLFQTDWNGKTYFDYSKTGRVVE